MTSPSVEPLIVPQLDARTTRPGTEVGGKAAFLLDICHRVRVPEFVVIPSSWFTIAAGPQLADIADRWCRWDTAHQKSVQSTRRLAAVHLTTAMRHTLSTQLDEFIPDVEVFAVRSSAAGEDGPDRSFAGLYDSVLDVPRADIEQAIVAVWRSWFSVSAITHRSADTWRPPVMAVVVQRMIDAEEAGVAAAYREAVEVEWVAGRGDRLVDGSVEPARRLVTAPMRDPRGRVEHAAAAAWALRGQLGVGDLDVEWAADQDRVWIVQARPLTAPLPSSAGVSWVSSSEHPVLRTAELYADTAPHDVLPLGPVAEVIGHYRTKRRPLYAIGSEHDCDLGTALILHFNTLGLHGPRWSDLVGQLGPHAVLDLSERERQVIVATSDLRQVLAAHCGDDPQRLRSVVIREFITGDCGAVSAVDGDDVRVEVSRDGLLHLNRGTASTDEFIIPLEGSRDHGLTTVPPEWSDSTLAVIDRVTRHLADRHGDAVVEWVLRAGRPVLVDYSLVDTVPTAMLPASQASVISSGACRGPALVIPASATEMLTRDSVAPVVSVGARLPHPADTAVNDLYETITQLAEPPVVVVDRPYAVLATLIPYVAGFVFTQPAARLCHLAILLRENHTPAVCVPADQAPQDGEAVAVGTDGQLHRGHTS
ncbi:PEP/pyruvate-binding domain-containing protein [Actinophytocola oryzae]|uniref:Phosphoenolpyruvate synthase n=1 Tax=Actinophytocola oryzae TaxID=502181 RepID=A0A4R7V4A9_9PSEU|nr:PEP/pyruvate-binding domain-containing protein [Actinophytocola oryzae]TDV44189.1 pyruvate phosphate dikinase-like enzyme [Actinophytocola oryzae]